ncbi:hypothetical protein NMY22_g16565 [Coprinellus aureogranulatus]|nr:hypothetical protein NMY22_g16565 [Coprinellus aureogranulatus]
MLGRTALHTQKYPVVLPLFLHTVMGEDNLPSELKSLVAAFCPFSSLPVLALLNKDFQGHAERLLYQSIAVQTFDGTGAGALATLEECRSKTQYVKSCNIEFDEEPQDADAPTLRGMFAATPTFKNLKSLTLRLRKDLRTPTIIRNLNAILCSDSFRLTALFVDDVCDLQSIANAQEKLKTLGVFQDNDRIRPLSMLNRHSERSFIALGLFCGGTTFPYYNNVVILPDLLDLELAQDFDCLLRSCAQININSVVDFDPKRVTNVSMYIRAPENRPEAFHAFTQQASQVLDVWCLSLFVRCDPRSLWVAQLIKGLAPKNIEIATWNDMSPDIYESTRVFEGSREAFASFLSGN